VPLPTCADGIDNDGDAHIDWPDDPKCLSASDNGETFFCAQPFVADLTGQQLPIEVPGSMVGAPVALGGACDDSVGPAPERVYLWRAPTAGRYAFGAYDPDGLASYMVYTHTESCAGPEQSCSWGYMGVDLAAGQEIAIFLHLQDGPSGSFVLYIDWYHPGS
jgi:hypothetical protein